MSYPNRKSGKRHEELQINPKYLPTPPFIFQVGEDKGERLKYILALFSVSQIFSVDIRGLDKIISKSKVEL